MKFLVVALMSAILAAPSFGKSHKDTYPVACSELWAAVKDTIGNPANYSIISTDNKEMTASYSIAGALRKRTNSLVLNSRGTSCEMQLQSNDSGFAHDDAGDFKKRVEDSLAKRKGSSPSEPPKPADPGK